LRLELLSLGNNLFEGHFGPDGETTLGDDHRI
jgi:hypothetical protein